MYIMSVCHEPCMHTSAFSPLTRVCQRCLAHCTCVRHRTFVLTSLLIFKMIFQTRIPTETTWIHCHSHTMTDAGAGADLQQSLLQRYFFTVEITPLSRLLFKFVHPCVVFEMQNEGKDFFCAQKLKIHKLTC